MKERKGLRREESLVFCDVCHRKDCVGIEITTNDDTVEVCDKCIRRAMGLINVTTVARQAADRRDEEIVQAMRQVVRQEMDHESG